MANDSVSKDDVDILKATGFLGAVKGAKKLKETAVSIGRKAIAIKATE